MERGDGEEEVGSPTGERVEPDELIRQNMDSKYLRQHRLFT